jgi:ribosomal protein S18 acetylase RimI-like enzyme
MSRVQVEPAGRVEDGTELAQQVRELYAEVDSEFVPALSQRGSVAQRLDRWDTEALPQFSKEERLEAYVQQSFEEDLLAAYVDGRFAGFMTYVAKYETEAIPAYCPCTYVMNLACHREFRGQGVARALYDAVMDLPPDLAFPFVATRTWTTNDAHIGLLAKLGFREVARLPQEIQPNVYRAYFARER